MSNHGAPAQERPAPAHGDPEDGTSAPSANQTKPTGGKQKRPSDASPPPTHFLALPLVTPHSLPQLARSIAHFQAATTSPRPLRPSEVQARERARQAEPPERDAQRDAAIERMAGQGDEGDGEVAALKIIPAQAHRAPGTLHLTLGTMVLRTPEEFRRALEVLREVDYAGLLRDLRGPRGGVPEAEEQTPQDMEDQQGERGAASIMEAGEEVAGSLRTLTKAVSPPASTLGDVSTKKGVLKVDLRGIGTFPSPKKARVFYAAPRDEAGRLQLFAEAIQRYFTEAGVVRKEGRPLTLHATVANLKYVKTGKQWGRGGKGRGGAGGGREGREIDARAVIEAFGKGGSQGQALNPEGARGEEFTWAAGIDIDRVRICKMGAVKSDDPAMGMEYPAIQIPVEGEEGEGELAEVQFV